MVGHFGALLAAKECKSGQLCLIAGKGCFGGYKRELIIETEISKNGK